MTDATFEADVLKSNVPVLVDFWAEWCAPCRRLAPKVKELAEEFGDRLRVVKLDVDANPRVASQMQVRAMPTLLVIKNGAVVGQLVGDQPKDKIKALIDLAGPVRSGTGLAKKRTGQWRCSALR
ncbi:MAG: thioredoxin [Myxococcota bacterium]